MNFCLVVIRIEPVLRRTYKSRRTVIIKETEAVINLFPDKENYNKTIPLQAWGCVRTLQHNWKTKTDKDK